MKITKTLLSVVVLTLFAFAFAGSAESDSFIDISEETTFHVTFDSNYTIANSVTFTLFPDKSGKCNFISDRELPYSRCTWRETELENPMSEGGNGIPLKAIRISVDGAGNFVITKEKEVYWVYDDFSGRMGKVGTCSRDGKTN